MYLHYTDYGDNNMQISKTISLNIEAELSGKTIKNIIRNHLGISSAIMIKLKKHTDGILVNGINQKVNTVLKKGDVLTINIRDACSKNIEPVEIALDILYEDNDILAVNKPRNMPTHPSQNHHGDTLANGVMYRYKNSDFTFRPITRLDKDTSGVVLIAKNPFSAAKLSKQMHSLNIQKQYVAVCHGIFDTKQGTIDAPIARVTNSMILRHISAQGKPAVTEYDVIREKNDISLVRLYPKTGRTHQLRVHMAHIFHPIYGDDLYGSPILDGHTLLHCEKICFCHPDTGKPMEICAAMPQDITCII